MQDLDDNNVVVVAADTVRGAAMYPFSEQRKRLPVVDHVPGAHPKNM